MHDSLRPKLQYDARAICEKGIHDNASQSYVIGFSIGANHYPEMTYLECSLDH